MPSTPWTRLILRANAPKGEYTRVRVRYNVEEDRWSVEGDGASHYKIFRDGEREPKRWSPLTPRVPIA
jgi:hypothetical protein